MSSQDGTSVYKVVMETLLASDSRPRPRGMPVREETDSVLRIEDPARAVPLGVSRKLRMAIGATEYTQLLAGVSCLTQLDMASGGRFSQFADNGKLRGAYGPRLFRQLPEAAEALRNDRDTRQAVAVIWRGHDNAGRPEGRPRDVPCTVAFQFLIRNDKLQMTAIMRSSDAWLGLPYDLWQFTRLQMTMAWALSVEPGPFTLFAGSLHLYEKDVIKAALLRDVPDAGSQQQPPAIIPAMPRNTQHPLMRMAYAQAAASEVAMSLTTPQASESVTWYRALVPEYPQGEDWCVACRYSVPQDQMEGGRCSECREE